MSSVQAYPTKTKKLSGTKYAEVYPRAHELYRQIQKRTKRRSYIRSAYFKKDKIFLGLFWQHIHDKLNMRDKTRRLKYFPCAIELLQRTTFHPTSKEDPNSPSDILHRFTGITPEKEIFFVQVKERKKTGQKHLISTFPFDV